MSVDEVRRAFSEQRELREAITTWRAHRVELIEQSRGPVILSKDVALLFHVIPTNAFAAGAFTEVWRAPESEKKHVFVASGNYYQRYNADGFLCHSNPASVGRPRQSTDGYMGYTQLFRSGIVEYAFSSFYWSPSRVDRPLIQGQVVEHFIIQAYEDAIMRFRRQGITGIVYVGFSMTGIEDKQIFTEDFHWAPRDYGIRQNNFISPEVMVDLNESEERPFERTLRPLVDMFWQLDGREGTPFIYEGEWITFRRY